MSAPASDPQTSRSGMGRYASPVILLALMWVIHAADAVLPGSFTGLGIRSWDPGGLPGILFAPLLHSGWPHLLGNSVPFLVLGLLVAADGAGRFWAVTAVVAVVSGIGTWVVNAPGTITVGASGLIFGYFAYVVVRVFFARGLAHRALTALAAVVVIVLYGGSLLAGLLPVSSGISWQAHLFGGVGGILVAVGLGRGRRGDGAA